MFEYARARQFAMQLSGKIRLHELALEPGALAPVANDEEAIVGNAVAPQSLLEVHQQADVFLRAEAPDVSQAEDVVTRVALGRRKQFRVHAAAHEEDWLTRA